MDIFLNIEYIGIVQIVFIRDLLMMEKIIVIEEKDI